MSLADTQSVAFTSSQKICYRFPATKPIITEYLRSTDADRRNDETAR